MIVCLQTTNVFYKDLGTKFEDLRLPDDDWAFIEEFSSAFEPVYALTKNVQSDNLILGDVYKFVKMCQLKLQYISPNNRFAEKIRLALDARAKIMMENNAFRAGMLFGQRWTFLHSPYVTTGDKLAAIVSIHYLYFRSEGEIGIGCLCSLKFLSDQIISGYLSLSFPIFSSLDTSC